jgi:hypothetical protein
MRLKCLFNLICEIVFQTSLYTTVCRWQGYDICCVSVAGFIRETFVILYDRKGSKPKRRNDFWIPRLLNYRLFALFIT